MSEHVKVNEQAMSGMRKKSQQGEIKHKQRILFNALLSRKEKPRKYERETENHKLRMKSFFEKQDMGGQYILSMASGTIFLTIYLFRKNIQMHLKNIFTSFTKILITC